MNVAFSFHSLYQETIIISLLLVIASKQAKRCRLNGDFEKLRRKKHFPDIIFQQDNAPVHKSKTIGTFSKKTSGRH